MKILQISTNWTPGGGIQTHVRDLSMWLTARGHNVSTAGQLDESQFEPPAKFLKLDLNRVSGEDGTGNNEPILLRIWWLFKCAYSLLRALKRKPVDVIHAHESAPLLVAWLATLGSSVPIILTYHGAQPGRMGLLVKIARRCATILISPSKTSAKRLSELGVPADRVRFVGLGVHHSPPPGAEDIGAIRDEFLGSTGTHLVISLSRLDEQKGLDAMLHAAAIVRESVPGIRILIGGRGPKEAELAALAQRLGVADIVHFGGNLDNVVAYLAAADLYLLTSRWEELPISIVEALRAGLPIVATDCGGVGELVDDKIGKLCEIDDLSEIAKGVVDILQNDELRQKMAKAALARSGEDRFDITAVNKKCEAIYLEALGD